VITGYNSEVRHGSRVFHVQTEDKGLLNPRIETLIYLGGEILDSYRGTYDDLLAQPPVQEPAIQARMDDQHRSVIREIKNGKYDATPNDDPLAEERVFNDRPLDQAILEYLASEGDVDTLEMVLDRPLRPVFGEPLSFGLRTRLCASQGPVPGAEVSIRLVSSLARPGTLGTGRTDADGCFTARVELPPSQPGHCTVVISCTSDFGNDEIRALVSA
jgi:hypothetical protein